MFLRKRNRGFTLIELLVVIAIIGVLASIVLASLNSARRKSRDARRIADVKQIQLALELYFDSNNNEYPPQILTMAGTQLPVEPKDPSTGNPYFYSTIGTPATSYHLGADLEENGTGAAGTGGNLALANDVDSSEGFAGLSVDCATAGADDGCYDLKP